MTEASFEAFVPRVPFTSMRVDAPHAEEASREPAEPRERRVETRAETRAEPRREPPRACYTAAEMQHLVDKAATLLEALPYIRRFHGEVFVLKYGGHAMIDPALRDSFARDVVLMKYVGLHPVVVHGGGPQIDATLASMGVVSERIDGLRVTDDRTMEVVEMVLGGRTNQEIVSLIGNHGGRAVGLTGRDDNFVRATRVTEMKTKSGKSVDPGRVGQVTTVRPDVVRRLIETGFIPVIAPIAVDEEGRSLNVNADTVAGKVAEALDARKLVLMTDIEGVRGKDGVVMSSLSAAEATALREDGVIDGGMIPKVACALEALAGGVKKAHIIDGRTKHAVLLELFTDLGIGTEITR
jgi:acetylglutamate kinase